MDFALDISAFPPISALLDLAHSAFVALIALFDPVAGAGSAALAIVLVTMAVRSALIPVGISQAKGEQVRARLAPRLAALRTRWAKNPERLQRETMQLYRDEHASPFTGCIPLLVQTPVVGLLYAVFLHPTIAGHSNLLLEQDVFGVALGSSPIGMLGAGTLDAVSVVVFSIVITVIALFGELTRRHFHLTPDASLAGGRLIANAAGILQFATAALAVFVPLAAGIYLAVTVAWTFVQRVILRGRFPIGDSA